MDKPFLKWVGGKTQSIDIIISKIPNFILNYHEIFLGGGSVLLKLLSLQKEGKIEIRNKVYAYDINDRLINLYKHIQSDKDKLMYHINFLQNTYNKSSDKKCLYYKNRILFNQIDRDSIESSALFMFLNKTGFRGMYRENMKGGFNVPYGNYKNELCIITKEKLDYISDLIKEVKFVHCHYRKALLNIKFGDFIYLDPPYFPGNCSKFVKYTRYGFTYDAHIELFTTIKEIKWATILMSNSNTDEVKKHFKKYEIIETKRRINPKNPESTTTELLISV